MLVAPLSHEEQPLLIGEAEELAPSLGHDGIVIVVEKDLRAGKESLPEVGMPSGRGREHKVGRTRKCRAVLFKGTAA